MDSHSCLNAYRCAFITHQTRLKKLNDTRWTMEDVEWYHRDLRELAGMRRLLVLIGYNETEFFRPPS